MTSIWRRIFFPDGLHEFPENFDLHHGTYSARRPIQCQNANGRGCIAEKGACEVDTLHQWCLWKERRVPAAYC